MAFHNSSFLAGVMSSSEFRSSVAGDGTLALDKEGAESQREAQGNRVNAGPAPPESEGIEDEDADSGNKENASHGLVLGSGRNSDHYRLMPGKREWPRSG